MSLGQFLRSCMSLSKKEISRAKFLENGICVDGARRKVTAVLEAGEFVEVQLETGERTSLQLGASDKELEVLYEDEDVIVLNKPAGLSVHPAGRGTFHGDTLANRLAFYLREKGEDCVIRILGRLDKDTSGVVLAAKSRTASARLEQQREAGILKKTYLAVVQGVPQESEGEISVSLGPDPEDRTRMRVCQDGKTAQTYYQVLKTFHGGRENGIEDGREAGERAGKEEERAVCSLVRLCLATGRTHQIRVHMAYIGCPLLGDLLYGSGSAAAGSGSPEAERRALIGRTALHASELVFCQPFTGRRLRISAPLPKDIARILNFVVE